MTKKKKSNFRDKVNKDAQKQQKGASYGYLNLPKGVNVYSPEPGSRIKLDFIPYEVTDKKHPDRDKDEEIALEGDLWYKRSFKIHRNVGVEEDTEVCLTSFGKKCPICEIRSKKAKEGVDKEELAIYKASARNLYVVIPIGSKKHDEEPHIMDISQWMFQKLLNEELEEDADYSVFPDLEEGLTLKIRWESRTIGKSQPFAEAGRIDFIERDEQYEESILEDVPNLDEVLNVLTYDELNAKFLELDEDDIKGEEIEDIDNNEDENKEEKKSHRKKKDATPEKESSKKSRKKKKEEDNDNDRCPHGHTFGKDCQKFKDCDSCEEWDDCDEASD